MPLGTFGGMLSYPKLAVLRLLRRLKGFHTDCVRDVKTDIIKIGSNFNGNGRIEDNILVLATVINVCFVFSLSWLDLELS